MTQKLIITRLIEKAGTISELSKITNTAIPRIYEWKKETYGINLHKLLDMCDKLEIELKELL